MSDKNYSGQLLPDSLASATGFLVLIQVSSRGLTFIANQVVLRNVSHETLGAAAQLELYSITVLYFSREFIRTAIQRQPSGSVSKTSGARNPNDAKPQSTAVGRDDIDPEASQTIVNMSYISITLGILLALVLGASYLRFSTEEVTQIPCLQIGVKLVCVACCVELATEPFFAIIQQRFLYKTRAIVETVAAISRCAATSITSMWAVRTGRDVGVLPFAIGHLVYALTLLCGYLCLTAYKHTYNFSFLLRSIQAK
jgi:oligosaccharide translocation protein RFT1